MIAGFVCWVRGRGCGLVLLVGLCGALGVIAGPASAAAPAVPQIYWANNANNTIGVANLDGKDVNESLITTGAYSPNAVALDGQHVYSAVYGNNTIWAANLDGSDLNESLITGAEVPFGVAVSVPVMSVSPGTPAAFASTPQGEASAPRTLTITNDGQQALSVYGLSFAGADPGDFWVGSDTCLGSVDPGVSCQLTVNFVPHAKGARRANLQIASNDLANSPISIPLTGTGGALPTGKRGPAGKIELVSCRTVKHKRSCHSRLVSGVVKFKTAARTATATVTRAGRIYATGHAHRVAGHWQLRLRYRRATPAGRYTLTLKTRRAGHPLTRRLSIRLR